MLNVDANLALTINGGETVNIIGNGDTVYIDIPDVKTALKLWRGQDQTFQNVLEQVQMFIPRADVTFKVRLKKSEIARLGPHTAPNLFSRLAGVAPLELKPLNALFAVLRRGE
jgi:hypothetical protein